MEGPAGQEHALTCADQGLIPRLACVRAEPMFVG